MKKKITTYWNYFYKNRIVSSNPTKFSKFCYKYLKNYKGILYDAGCGNGRDTIFFYRKKLKIIGIDISSRAIELNKKKNPELFQNFKKKNFCEFFRKKIKERFSVYLRFTIHTINLQEENFFLRDIFNQTKLDYLFIETRTTQDELYGLGKKIGKNEFFSDHYRRFIVPSEFKKKFSKKMKIIYFNQSRNFAVYKNYRPNVLRIILKKK